MSNSENRYKVLKNKNFFSKDNFSIVPIRYEDRYEIMRWRNEQLYHLRQKQPLTKLQQDKYFKEEVAVLFHQKKPKQLLLSFLKDKKLVGYGGLVHIDWDNKNAEISFILDTSLEKYYFKDYWKIFLNLIEDVGFNSIKMNKLYVYSFNLRPKLYEVMKENNYTEEAKLIQHSLHNKKFIDVLIHSKINKNDK